MNTVFLRELAHARAGDKGDTAILSVFPLDDRDYEWLRTYVTAEAVKHHLADYINGDVERFDVPLVCGLQFVCTHALGGGVTTSLALDSHGKSLSSRLLAMRIPARPEDANSQRCSSGETDIGQR
ncbi:AtuA-related protein [Mycolicibacterium goodii]|uniref:AtuA-related protein n=1 Tax=Mycolicibacterium goodii TaxID=134601 RepID=UPI00257BFE42|nr:hypothetical protein [Mycolicibacterium goodii]